MSGCLVRGVRLVDIVPPRPVARIGFGTAPRTPGPGTAEETVDVRIVDGIVTQVETGLAARPGEDVHDGGGRWAIPGLWDAHVHMGQWAATTTRFDLGEATSVAHACAIVAQQVATMPRERPETVCGFGYRMATWPDQPTVARLDEVSRDLPVVLIGGDCHSGWLNSVALRLLGLPPREDILVEQEWFDVFPLLEQRLPGLAERAVLGYRQAVADATAMGVTGIVDLEFARGVEQWPSRFSDDRVDGLRVRIGTYADGLEDVIAAGLHTGEEVGESGGLLTMGPLKIISDGSLNTRTAYCCEPYADGDEIPHPAGVQNVDFHDLRRLLQRASEHGLDVALHAIGDAAVRDALDAFEITGARGTIEHAQLMCWDDMPRMGRLGVAASVQPAHVWDDRDVARRCWPDRMDRCFPFRSLVANGVSLALGSDAPVSPLDPWLAMAAAVHRSADAREPWMPYQALTVAEALGASTDGQGTIGRGSRGDLALLDADPYAVPENSAEAAATLREVPVAATFVAGRLVHG